MAGLMAEHADELALLDCLNIGKPIADARTMAVPFAVEILRWFAAHNEPVHEREGNLYRIAIATKSR
jgi:4-(gamma-glutamylamino)butanal dehydrogenase